MAALSEATVPSSPAAAEAPAAPEVPPPFSDVVSGIVPGVSLAPIEGRETDPAQEFAVSHFQDLGKLGLDYWEAPDLHSVIFNPAKISEQQLNDLYKSGKLSEVAPLVTSLSPIGQKAAPPADAAAPLAPQASTAPAEAPSAPLAQGAPLAQSTASVPTDGGLRTARIRNAAPARSGAPNPVPQMLGRRAI